MKNLKLLLLGAFAILAGCKSSYVTSSWKAKEIEVKRYNKVLVLGLIKEDDRRLQEKMEEHLAGDLRSLGYNAVTSLQTFGPKAFDNLSEKEALDKLNSSELDAVITIVLLNKQLEQEFIPNNPVPQRQTFYYRGRFWNYYGAVRNQVFIPGYYVENTKYFWESNLYQLDAQSLVYSVQTQSFNPNTAESLGHEYGRMIVKDMVNKNVLKNQTNVVLKGF